MYPGEQRQNYYINGCVGIAVGFLLAALHAAKLATLTDTPNPVKFLNQLCSRPSIENPVMIVAVGHTAPGATIPVHATIKKPLEQIATWL